MSEPATIRVYARMNSRACTERFVQSVGVRGRVGGRRFSAFVESGASASAPRCATPQAVVIQRVLLRCQPASTTHSNIQPVLHYTCLVVEASCTAICRVWAVWEPPFGVAVGFATIRLPCSHSAPLDGLRLMTGDTLVLKIAH